MRREIYLKTYAEILHEQLYRYNRPPCDTWGLFLFRGRNSSSQTSWRKKIHFKFCLKMIVIQRLTAFVLLLTLAVLVTVLALLYTMPKSTQQPTCERLCLPSDPFALSSEIRCAYASDRLKEYLVEAIMKEENRLNEEAEKKTTTGPTPQLMGLLSSLRWNIKPSARVTGKKQSPHPKYDIMAPVRDWHIKDDRAFLRYGMEYRHGRLVVPAKGIYLIHSFLDLYEQSKNVTTKDDMALVQRHTYNDQSSPSIKHAVYRFNILNGTEEELIRTEHSREVPQNGYFNIYDSYLSAAVELHAGDEVYIKISDLDLLAHPSSNFFGVSMI